MSVSLFDSYKRTDRSGGNRSESESELLDRADWKCLQDARDTLESWFSKMPDEKKAGLRGDFRGDDGHHASALLELVTHETLRATSSNVVVEPELDGGRPDFEAEFKDTRFIAECIVAQQSNKKFGALQRERTVLDVVDSIDAGPFRLVVQPQRIGESQPRSKVLRGFLNCKLTPLVQQARTENYPVGHRLGPILWEWQDWNLRFELIFVGAPTEDGAIGATIGLPRQVVSDTSISRALETKAEKYRNPRAPYLVVVSERQTAAEETVILDALFGPVSSYVDQNGSVTEARGFNGFWGNQSQSRKNTSRLFFTSVV